LDPVQRISANSTNSINALESTSRVRTPSSGFFGGAGLVAGADMALERKGSPSND
jgi:hypothetical protein